MPTNYPGVKTNTQSPSVVPQNEGTITIALPADGDPPNASTFAQGFKVCADWIMYLLAPVVKIAASAADWARSLIRFRSAAGHTRSHVDHLGIVSGRIQSWREHWELGGTLGASVGTTGPMDLTGNAFLAGGGASFFNSLFNLGTHLAAAASASTGALATALSSASGDAIAASVVVSSFNGFSAWKAHILETSGTSSLTTGVPSSAGSPLAPHHRTMIFSAGDTSGDFTLLWRKATVAWHDDLTFKLEWEMQLAAADLVKDTVTAGFSIEDGLTAGASLATDYAVFVLAPGGGHWFINNRGSSGSVNSVDTGVSASTARTRFKIEFHGANVSDNSARAIRFYINGTQVGGDVTTLLPASTVNAAPHFCSMNTGGGSGGVLMGLGPVSFGSNLYPSDVT